MVDVELEGVVATVIGVVGGGDDDGEEANWIEDCNKRQGKLLLLKFGRLNPVVP